MFIVPSSILDCFNNLLVSNEGLGLGLGFNIEIPKKEELRIIELRFNSNNNNNNNIIMASFATLTAPIKWAQRKESVLVTISLADVKDYSV